MRGRKVGGRTRDGGRKKKGGCERRERGGGGIGGTKGMAVWDVKINEIYYKSKDIWKVRLNPAISNFQGKRK